MKYNYYTAEPARERATVTMLFRKGLHRAKWNLLRLDLFFSHPVLPYIPPASTYLYFPSISFNPINSAPNPKDLRLS